MTGEELELFRRRPRIEHELAEDGEGEDDLYPGSARAVDSFWTISACSETDCSRTASLYCFQTEAD